MNVSPAVLYVVALTLGLALLALEVFLPGGLAGLLGMLMIAGAVGVGLMTFPYPANIWSTVIVLVFGGLGVLLWLQLFPRTKAGKRIALNTDAADWKSYAPAKSLLGKSGEAVTALRPGGIALLDGKRYDVLAESGEWIAAGSRIRVIEVKDGNIIVASGETDA